MATVIYDRYLGLLIGRWLGQFYFARDADEKDPADFSKVKAIVQMMELLDADTNAGRLSYEKDNKYELASLMPMARECVLAFQGSPVPWLKDVRRDRNNDLMERISLIYARILRYIVINEVSSHLERGKIFDTAMVDFDPKVSFNGDETLYQKSIEILCIRMLSSLIRKEILPSFGKTMDVLLQRKFHQSRAILGIIGALTGAMIGAKALSLDVEIRPHINAILRTNGFDAKFISAIMSKLNITRYPVGEAPKTPESKNDTTAWERVIKLFNPDEFDDIFDLPASSSCLEISGARPVFDISQPPVNLCTKYIEQYRQIIVDKITADELKGNANYISITDNVIRKIIDLYDLYFFKGFIAETLKAKNLYLLCQFNKRLTSTAGHVTTKNIMIYLLIELSSSIFFRTFSQGETQVNNSGVISNSRIECLCITIEHELCHVLAMINGQQQYLQMKKSNKAIYGSHGEIFKRLVYGYFQHTEHTHTMPTVDVTVKEDREKLPIGKIFKFKNKNNVLVDAIVTRINRKTVTAKALSDGRVYLIPYQLIIHI